MASGVEMRSKRRNWKTPAAERVAAGMEEELREHRDEKQHKITSLLMMELHGHATPAKPQAAAGLRALEHMYRGSGAPWAGEAPTLLAKEHKLQQAAPPPPAKPSQATATRLKSIENLYRELGTPSRGSGRNGSQGAAGGRRMAANDFDDVHSEGWDRPFAARRREGRSGAASVDMTASVAARWEEGDLAMDSKRQAAATEGWWLGFRIQG
ncbi:hypothetical protein T484DRAFT_2976015 [Baffinella frigidus]|nr:hypothetical protein T484DRAFT_2976015 [Cryptophyta sp. CCMP2293]